MGGENIYNLAGQIDFGTIFHPMIVNGDKFYKYELKKHGLVNVPEICGVYIMQFNNEWFYIGQTKNIQRRIAQHFTNILFKDLSNTKWYQNVEIKSVDDFNLYIIETQNRKEMERKIIFKLKDIVNLYNTEFVKYSVYD